MAASSKAEPGSISRLLALLRAGDDAAASALYQRVLSDLQEHCTKQLRRLAVRTEAFDHNDLVQEVLPAALERLKRGEGTDIVNRGHLWGHLFQAAEWRAKNERQRQRALRRGGGRRTLNSASSPDEGSFDGPLDQTPARDALPTDIHSLLVLIEQEFGRVSERERPILLLMLQGYTDREVADRTGWSVATVERIKRSIRERLEREMQDD